MTDNQSFTDQDRDDPAFAANRSTRLETPAGGRNPPRGCCRTGTPCRSGNAVRSCSSGSGLDRAGRAQLPGVRPPPRSGPRMSVKQAASVVVAGATVLASCQNLILLTAGVVLVVAILIALLVLPTIWSRLPERRREARRTLVLLSKTLGQRRPRS